MPFASCFSPTLHPGIIKKMVRFGYWRGKWEYCDSRQLPQTYGFECQGYPKNDTKSVRFWKWELVVKHWKTYNLLASPVAAAGKLDLQLGNLEAAQEKVQVGPLELKLFQLLNIPCWMCGFSVFLMSNMENLKKWYQIKHWISILESWWWCLGCLRETVDFGPQEALTLFESTSGSDSPLMSGAYKRLGEIYMKKDHKWHGIAFLGAWCFFALLYGSISCWKMVPWCLTRIRYTELGWSWMGFTTKSTIVCETFCNSTPLFWRTCMWTPG